MYYLFFCKKRQTTDWYFHQLHHLYTSDKNTPIHMVIWTLERSLYILCKKIPKAKFMLLVNTSQNNSSIKLKGSFFKKNEVKKFLIVDTSWKQILK